MVKSKYRNKILINFQKELDFEQERQNCYVAYHFGARNFGCRYTCNERSAASH